MGPVDQMTFPKDQKCGKPPYENGTENGTDISGMGTLLSLNVSYSTLRTRKREDIELYI